ncbi:DNA repair protein XRCC2 [Rhinatrema bivittatum]|uniref:DNA repair protein XRCC2 n=1 Tax=Rhinatrema bivittatum TaxID=194408 RepID=UPI001126B822|nr:DNA repair protein XRCC2 [Rhinatrema bivittatum]
MRHHCDVLPPPASPTLFGMTEASALSAGARPRARGGFPPQTPGSFCSMSARFRRAESGTELLARLEGRSSLKNLEPLLFAEEGFPIHGDVIEFYGPEGTGKTEMFYHLLARCILPKPEGLQVEVIFIDTDYHFDMLRLVTILEHRLSQSTEEMIKETLSRLFLVYCNSSIQLLLTLHALESMFCSHSSLCLLILDSISAFYWIDRNNGGESFQKQEANLKKCTEFLRKLLKEYQLVLFASTQAIMQKSSHQMEGPSLSVKLQCNADTDYRPYLCKSWQNLVTHRMFFSKRDKCGGSKQDFEIISCHTRNHSAVKCLFSIAECGVQFLTSA